MVAALALGLAVDSGDTAAITKATAALGDATFALTRSTRSYQ